MKTQIKPIWDLRIGDMVTYNSNVWFITKSTKTQYTAQKFGSDGKGKYDFIRLTINSGMVVGERSWARVLETTPEIFYAKIRAAHDEEKAIANEREQAWQAKLEIVKAANSNGHILITDEGMGLSKATMINSKGEPMMVYFSQQVEEYWQNYREAPVKGVRIQCSTWRNDGWRDEVRYGFSQTDARGLTVEAALIDLVAAHYWN